MVSNRKIIEGCIKGKRRSFSLLYRKFAPVMLGVCMRYARNRSEAEDILQEGFIKVFMNICRFRQEGSFEGWIRRIMINTAIDHYHKNRLVDFQSDFDHLNDIVDASQIQDDNKYNAYDLSCDTLLAMIRTLPPGYQLIFNLYAIEGCSHREIADLLNISVSTSKSQLFKARKSVQKKIDEYSSKKIKDQHHEEG